jgi:hypothetical protein
MTGNLVLNFGKMSFLKGAENGRKWSKPGEKRDEKRAGLRKTLMPRNVPAVAAMFYDRESRY